MDILQFPVYLRSQTHGRANGKAENFSLLEGNHDINYCLFSIEVRNTYGSPFDVTLARSQDNETAASSTTTIPPGSVSR